jgi:hypothetical protein
VWLAVILACVTPQSDTCDTLVRTGGFFLSKDLCAADLEEIAPKVSKTNYYVKTYCFKLPTLGEPA